MLRQRVGSSRETVYSGTWSNDDARTNAGGLQDEVTGLGEMVQRLSSENETLRVPTDEAGKERARTLLSWHY